ncbi:MAG: amidohydrolase family protein [Anaerolineae bacterium]|nr:amidohydrolase family protein [Anaerolineae bacterium]
MQNVHTHAWAQALHFNLATVHEADLSRGHPLDLTVQYDAFMADMAPFDRVIVFGLKGLLTGYWVPDAYIADFVARAPGKLVGFASCDPTGPSYMDELTHSIEDLGLRGLKLGPIYAGFDPRDPRCAPVYDYCESRGLPIITHTGTTYNRAAPLGVSRPWLWDEVAIQHPELRIVLAHLGHPFYDECLAVIRKHPHVYSDLSALFYRPWQFYNMLIAAQEYGVTRKLLFGTDYPFAGTQESIDGFRSINGIIGSSGLPRVTNETIDGILSRDSLALLGVSR